MTPNARLQLFDMLDYLGKSVCAFDTHFVFYINNLDYPKDVKLGSLLEKWNLKKEAIQ